MRGLILYSKHNEEEKYVRFSIPEALWGSLGPRLIGFLGRIFVADADEFLVQLFRRFSRES